MEACRGLVQVVMNTMRGRGGIRDCKLGGRSRSGVRSQNTKNTENTAMDPEQEQAVKRRQVEAIRQQMGEASQKAQQWSQQYLENDMVLKELVEAGEGGTIYKMMGGVLIKQEYVEAVSNVKKRMEFIKKEETRCAESIEGLQKEAAKLLE